MSFLGFGASNGGFPFGWPRGDHLCVKLGAPARVAFSFGFLIPPQNKWFPFRATQKGVASKMKPTRLLRVKKTMDLHFLMKLNEW